MSMSNQDGIDLKKFKAEIAEADLGVEGEDWEGGPSLPDDPEGPLAKLLGREDVRAAIADVVIDGIDDKQTHV